MSQTLPEIIGISLALAFVTTLAFTILGYFHAAIMAAWRRLSLAVDRRVKSIRKWWLDRHPDPGWQPTPSWKRKALRKHR